MHCVFTIYINVSTYDSKWGGELHGPQELPIIKDVKTKKQKQKLMLFQYFQRSNNIVNKT
jgi:hypothetical protein